MVLQYFNVDCMWGDCIVGFVHVKIYKAGDYMTGQILLTTVLTTSLHVVFYLWVFNIFQAHPERWNAFISFCTMDGARLTLENRFCPVSMSLDFLKPLSCSFLKQHFAQIY